MSKRVSNVELLDEMSSLDEEFFLLSQRVNSLRSLLAKYCEYELKEKFKEDK